jgi:hypothetical protein
LVVALALFGGPSATAAPSGVAVVRAAPGADEKVQRELASVVLAIQRELTARGRKLVDPARVLQGQPAEPEELSARADQALEQAVKHYDSLEFGQARPLLKSALALKRDAIKNGASSEGYVKVLHYDAAAAFYDNDHESAQRLFVRALAFAPKARPDEGIFSPDVIKFFNETKKAIKQKGALRLTCAQTAEVFINGRPAGVTPMVVQDLLPGHYLVRMQSPGYDAAVEWIEVQQGVVAGISGELKQGARHDEYQRALAAATAELKLPRPGPAVVGLQKTLGAGSVILVARRGERVQVTWAEGGFWVKRHEGQPEAEQEAKFANAFLAAGPPVLARGTCTSDSDCSGGKRCQQERCVTPAGPKPVYKKWWFWTIIGAVVAGGATVGVVMATRPANWSAEIVPGGGP